jgi:competence ComEA-like helix-hairpin-helix protein
MFVDGRGRHRWNPAPSMKNDLIETNSARHTGAPLARLGASHGYQFEQDTVLLNALFTLLDPAAHGLNWSLQLWACPQAPTDKNDLRGVLVAEAALPPIGEIADEQESFSIRATAFPPAGQGTYVMVLALVGGARGQRGDVQDFATYARPEQFTQPRLGANVAFRVDGDRVILDVERIENPRVVENTSGTLALELWALKSAYAGGEFQGEMLAGVAFGSLSGQHEFVQQSFNLPFTVPSAGTWHYVLMLREWTAAGFVTRDFVNFALPVVIAETKAPVKAETKSAAKKSDQQVRAKDASLSINTASAQELRAAAGLPAKVAESIVAKRPFKSLDEVQKVKGIGARLFERIRAKLRL